MLQNNDTPATSEASKLGMWKRDKHSSDGERSQQKYRSNMRSKVASKRIFFKRIGIEYNRIEFISKNMGHFRALQIQWIHACITYSICHMIIE